ncbi:MAG TPA: bifunctional riboflavin kinase/FMN adenylyltransferase, partial [Thiopseudomonas sp.]|nr:bifunctional riboflavin kinase/FMN adenylyltransferase [Thiopseudomonas sp.]
MQLVRGLHNVRPAHHGCVATIGNFDGVHLGHQAILTRLRNSAARLNVPCCVIIFEPQPREFFNPETAPVRLTRLRDKLQLFRDAGIDQVLCIAFNKRFRQLSAAEFVQTVLVDALGIQHLQVGDDFRFGCDRAGDFAFLQEAGQRCGFSVEPTATIEIDQQRVSSTRVRAALAAADFPLAERLLGRPYQIDG